MKRAIKRTHGCPPTAGQHTRRVGFFFDRVRPDVGTSCRITLLPTSLCVGSWLLGNACCAARVPSGHTCTTSYRCCYRRSLVSCEPTTVASDRHQLLRIILIRILFSGSVLKIIIINEYYNVSHVFNDSPYYTKHVYFLIFSSIAHNYARYLFEGFCTH